MLFRRCLITNTININENNSPKKPPDAVFSEVNEEEGSVEVVLVAVLVVLVFSEVNEEERSVEVVLVFVLDGTVVENALSDPKSI